MRAFSFVKMRGMHILTKHSRAVRRSMRPFLHKKSPCLEARVLMNQLFCSSGMSRELHTVCKRGISNFTLHIVNFTFRSFKAIKTLLRSRFEQLYGTCSLKTQKMPFRNGSGGGKWKANATTLASIPNFRAKNGRHGGGKPPQSLSPVPEVDRRSWGNW